MFLYFICLLLLVLNKNHASETQRKHRHLRMALANKNIQPRVFFKNVNLGLAKEFSKNVRIFYGNKDYGYYESKDLEVKNGQVRANIIPPGYKKEINFYKLEEKNKSPLFIKKLSFSHPIPFFETNVKALKDGDISSNYFSTSPEPEAYAHIKNYLFMNLIFNKYGEIVWAHVPPKVKNHAFQVRHFTSLGLDRFLLGSWTPTIIDAKANIVLQGPPFPFHHDCDIGEEDYQYFCLTKDYQFVRQSVFDSPIGFESSAIKSVNLNKDTRPKKILSVFDFYEQLKPDTLYPYRFNGPKKKEYDWTHENSIQVTQDGILVSMRNIDKVVMFSKDGKRLKWTLGNEPSDTYTLPHEFRIQHQHHAQMVNKDELTLFNNGKTVSRAMKIKLAQPPEVLFNVATPEKTQRNLGGSVYSLKNGNYLAYFPTELTHNKLYDHHINIFEINEKTQERVANLKLKFLFGLNFKTYKVEPLDAISDPSVELELSK